MLLLSKSIAIEFQITIAIHIILIHNCLIQLAEIIKYHKKTPLLLKSGGSTLLTCLLSSAQDEPPPSVKCSTFLILILTNQKFTTTIISMHIAGCMAVCVCFIYNSLSIPPYYQGWWVLLSYSFHFRELQVVEVLGAWEVDVGLVQLLFCLHFGENVVGLVEVWGS